jgi:hypothetical protein
MSVLSFPRIYFQGFMCWDPPTGNNNDQFPTYAYDKAQLNWGYLAQFHIDPGNFTTTFRDWFSTDLEYTDSKGKKRFSPPGEWNMFGTNACYFVQFEDVAQGIVRKSRITGGASALNTPVTQDALFDKPIELIGDLFGSPEAARPGRLVDNNPASSYSSQIYFNSMRLGDEETGISGPCYRRMHSRFIGNLRNPNLPSAGHTAVTWQTCFPKQGLTINVGKSALLRQLQNLIDTGKAQGVMVRFNTYLNLYYQNGYFNVSPKMPETISDTSAMYKKAYDTQNQFVNPCYSRFVGTVGPWDGNELVSVPQGRFLSAANGVVIPIKNPYLAKNAGAQKPLRLSGAEIHGGPRAADEPKAAVAGANINVPQPDAAPVAQLGVTLLEIDYALNTISIDASNTFPEMFWQGDKIDLGNITLAIKDGNGGYTPIVPVGKPYNGYTLAPADYDAASYESGCGIIDFQFDPGLASQIQNGDLVVRVVAQDGSGIVEALTERAWSAQTDDRGIYLNEGESTSFNVSVFLRGQPAANAKLMIAKYAPALSSDPLSYVGTPVLAISAKAPQIVSVTNGQSSVVTVMDGNGQNPIPTEVTVVDVDGNGIARIDLSAVSAGLPVLMFYPFAAGSQPPLPQYEFDTQAAPSGVSFYTTVRVLPFDDAFVDQFVQLWNSTYDPAQAWHFIYSNILYLYDMIYPVMLRFVPLGDRQRVEAAVDQVLTLIAPDYFAESTLAMPITRDMSEGKRSVLQLWGGLVKRGYPPQPIQKPTRATG